MNFIINIHLCTQKLLCAYKKRVVPFFGGNDSLDYTYVLLVS